MVWAAASGIGSEWWWLSFEAMKGGQYLKKVGEVEAIGVWCGGWNGWQVVDVTCN